MSNERSTKRFFIHKSGMSGWRKCPRKLLHMYLQPKQQMSVDGNEATSGGHDLHAAARQFTYIYDAEVLFSLPTYIDRLKYLTTCIPTGLSQKIYDWVQNIADFEARRSLDWPLGPLKFKPILQEQYLESEEFNYAGTLDRLDYHRSGLSYVISDYKPRVYDVSILRQEQAIYWVLVNDQLNLDLPINYWSVIGYDAGIYHEEEFKKPTFTALKKNTEKLWGIYEQWQQSHDPALFPMKPGEICDWCGYLGVCWSDPEYAELAFNSGVDYTPESGGGAEGG